jgi:hypothetical protein
MLRIGALAALAAAVATPLSACSGGRSSNRPARSTTTRVKVLPLVIFRPRLRGRGCGGAGPAGPGVEAVPATVSVVQGQVGVFVGVCIGGTGPYPFLVDTGASTTEIDARLASRLRLPRIGSLQSFNGAGCTTHAQGRLARSWSVAGLALRPQTVMTLPIPSFGEPGEAMGVIGSDIWQRFGRLRIDFQRRELVVPVPEQPTPSGRTVIARPAPGPLPRALARRGPAATLPMRVTASPQGVRVAISVEFAGGAAVPFIPDTGSTASVVSASVAKAAQLKRLDQDDTQTTFCSRTVTPRVDSGEWFIVSALEGRPGHRERLRPQPLDGIDLGGGWGGLLGSDQMEHFQSVVFDYAGGRLALGAG